MDSMYYVLIILGVSFGLIVFYIILRNMKVIGPIPIVSDIIDPILNAPFTVMKSVSSYYHDGFIEVSRTNGKSESFRRFKSPKDIIEHSEEGPKTRMANAMKRIPDNRVRGYTIHVDPYNGGGHQFDTDTDNLAKKSAIQGKRMEKQLKKDIKYDVSLKDSIVFITHSTSGGWGSDNVELITIVNDNGKFLVVEESEDTKAWGDVQVMNKQKVDERINNFLTASEYAYK